MGVNLLLLLMLVKEDGVAGPICGDGAGRLLKAPEDAELQTRHHQRGVEMNYL